MSILSQEHAARKSGIPKKRPTCSSFLSWVKQHTSEIDLGCEIEDAKGIHPIHLNTNQQVIEHFANLRRGDRSWLDARWDWAKLKDHACGNATYYFAGAPESGKPRTMFLIDVDCKRRGTPEGARAYLTYIASDQCGREYGLSFPGLYTEPSTHERGGHGFPLLEKWDCGPDMINKALLHRLQPWLNRIAQEKRFDIEFVEVKGTLPCIEWGANKYEIQSYTSGCLGKLPRKGQERFEELRNTSVITIWDLLRLPVQEKRSANKEAFSSCEVDGTRLGSISGRHITEDMLAGLRKDGRYRVVAERLLGRHTLRTSGRQVATLEDVMIILMLGEWLTNNMLPNGAMPEQRWTKLWGCLFECGDLQRAWCHKRFKAIRDWLSALALIHWEDHAYERGWYDWDGTYQKGTAAKWRFGDKLMDMLAHAKNNVRPEFVDNGVGERDYSDAAACPDNREKEEHPLWEHVQHDGAVADCKEKGRHPLWEQSIQDSTICVINQPNCDVVRPVERCRQAVHLIDPDEATRLVGSF